MPKWWFFMVIYHRTSCLKFLPLLMATRNPKANPRSDGAKTLQNNGINHQPQLVFSPDFGHQQYHSWLETKSKTKALHLQVLRCSLIAGITRGIGQYSCTKMTEKVPPVMWHHDSGQTRHVACGAWLTTVFPPKKKTCSVGFVETGYCMVSTVFVIGGINCRLQSDEIVETDYSSYTAIQ